MLKSIRFLLAAAWIMVAFSAFAENRLALVIGINDYPRLSADSQLRRAVNDANAVGDTLESLGFQVSRVIRGAGLNDLLGAFGRFTAKVQPGDTVVFYYAGHGISLDDGNYLIPADVPPFGPGDTRLAKRLAWAERDVKQDLRSAGARVAFVVLDACRNNPFALKGSRTLSGMERGLARFDTVEGVFSLYSAREGQAALDRLSDTDPDQNSVFTRVFLRTLKTPGVSLSELGDIVRDDVSSLARSHGLDQVPAVSNDLIGSRNIFLAGPAELKTKPNATSSTTNGLPNSVEEKAERLASLPKAVEPPVPVTIEPAPPPPTAPSQDSGRPLGANFMFLETKDGRITIKLRPDLAPRHVAQIKKLIGQHFYDGIVFHRVIEGFMAQTGDPTGTGMGGSKLPDIRAEFTSTPFKRGTVGMARASDPDSANSQFFICLADSSFLNNQYTVVGEVTDGMAVVDKIKKGSSIDNGKVDSPDKIVRMRMASDSK